MPFNMPRSVHLSVIYFDDGNLLIEKLGGGKTFVEYHCYVLLYASQFYTLFVCENFFVSIL